MEKELRSIVCPDHNLRYDPTQTDGCVRCMRLLGTTGAGRTAKPAAAAQPASANSKVVPTIILVSTLVFGWLLTRTVREKAPEGAFLDPNGRFAIVVPPRWKTVDPSTVTYLRNFMSDDEAVATLISDKGRLAPTIMIDVTEGTDGPARQSLIEEFEKGVREGWGEEGKLDLNVGLDTVDRIRSFRATLRAELQRQKLTMESYLVPGRKHSYMITAFSLGDKPEETASAARTIADGFRVLERPLPFGRLPLRIFLGLLAAALIGSIRALAKS